MAAIVLLFCSQIYLDKESGKTYIFATLFWDAKVKEWVRCGEISLYSVFIGSDTSYLWMFGPIIVGIPCILTKKTERLLMFRYGKNKYCFGKMISNLVMAGLIALLSYITFGIILMISSHEWFIDSIVLKKIGSEFIWGIYIAIPSLLLIEFVKNKYVIICLSFVINYFYIIFLGPLLPKLIDNFLNPQTYQILLSYDTETIIKKMFFLIIIILGCAILKRKEMDRRCDCGQ